MPGLKTVFLAASLAGFACGLLLLAATLLPLYVIEGPISGYVAPSWYSIALYGERVFLSSLDAATIYSIPVLSASVLSVIIGVAGVYASLKGMIEGYSECCEESCDDVAAAPGFFIELVFASSLAYVMMLGLYAGILFIEGVEVAGLQRSFDLVTSAGYLRFGSSKLSTTPLYYLVAVVKLPAFAGLAYVGLAAYTFIDYLRRIYG